MALKLPFDFANFQRARGSIVNALRLLPDPDEILKKMGKDLTALRSVLDDTRVSGALLQRKSAIDSYEIYIKEDDKNAKALKEFFANTKTSEIFNAIFDSILFGYSISEIYWEKNGEMFSPAKIITKPQEWFSYRYKEFGTDKSYSDGGEWVFLTKDQKDGVALPPNKFLICTNEASYTNPYGKKLLSRLFWYVVFRKGGWKFFYGFVEKYGMPWSIGKLPRNASPDTILDMSQRLDEMVQSAVAVIPDDSSIQLLETTKAKGDTHSGFLQELNTEIAIAILGQNLTSEVKSGSYAAAQTHAGVAESIEKSDRAHIQEHLNELVKIIYTVNGWQTPPRVELVKNGDIDEALAIRDGKLFAQGVNFSKKYYIKTYGFEEDDIDVSRQAGGSVSSFSESKPTFQSALDSSLSELLGSKEVASSFDAITSPILQALEATGDYNEALDALAQAFPKMSTSALQKSLERAIFASEVAGYVEVKA